MNLHKRLRKLTPAARQGYGTVVATDPGGAHVQLPGGAIVRVRGAATVGETVFFSGDVIDGPAPANLTYVPQEV